LPSGQGISLVAVVEVKREAFVNGVQLFDLRKLLCRLSPVCQYVSVDHRQFRPSQPPRILNCQTACLVKGVLPIWRCGRSRFDRRGRPGVAIDDGRSRPLQRVPVMLTHSPASSPCLTHGCPVEEFDGRCAWHGFQCFE
jgi:hypothetical protein